MPSTFGPTSREGFFEIVDRDPQDVEDGFRRWHAEPRRGVAIDEGLRLARRARRGLPRVGRAVFAPVDRRLDERALVRSRRLVWRSWYVHEIGASLDIEGYLVTDCGRYYPLTFLCGGHFAAVSKYSWDSGDLFCPPAWRQFVLPTDAFTPEVAEEGLRRWYMDRFEWRRGHWSVREGRLPELVSDISWIWPEDEDLYARARQQAADANDLIFAPSGERTASLRRRFGLSGSPTAYVSEATLAAGAERGQRCRRRS